MAIMIIASKISHWPVFLDLQLFQLTLLETLATRLQGDMGNLLINLPNLGYCSILQKIGHLDKPGSREITAEPQKMHSYPYSLSVLSRKLEASKSSATTLIEIAVSER